MKKLIILLIFALIISGCTGKSVNNVDNATASENLMEDWFQYTYAGPAGQDNSENARMSIIPYLRELGWDGGINVIYGQNGQNDTIIILIPFKLSNINQFNQTLSNYGFEPITLDEIVKIRKR